MKKILLLGGSAQQVVAINAAKEMGVYTILCDYLLDNPGQFVADKFYLVSTTDKEAVLKVAMNEKIDGILAYASDPAAPTAAFVAKRLNLPGNPLETIEILCNKDKFRKFLSNNEFHTPVMHSYSDISSATQDKAFWKFPVIVKPVDSSGSKGVTVLYSYDEILKAFESAFAFSREKKIIVEEYIEKKHPYLIGGDIFVIDGEIVLWGLLNCHRDCHVNPLVPVGKSYPLELEDGDIKNVQKTLSILVKKVGMKNGPMNVELVVDKAGNVWPIDVGPRSGGNMIPELLSDMYGVDIAKMSIQLALGMKIAISKKNVNGYYATHNLHSNVSGRYEDILFSKNIEQFIYRKCIYKKARDKVEYFDNASKCLGIIFLHFDTEMQKDKILKNINSEIKIILS